MCSLSTLVPISQPTSSILPYVPCLHDDIVLFLEPFLLTWPPLPRCPVVVLDFLMAVPINGVHQRVDGASNMEASLQTLAQHSPSHLWMAVNGVSTGSKPLTTRRKLPQIFPPPGFQLRPQNGRRITNIFAVSTSFRYNALLNSRLRLDARAPMTLHSQSCHHSLKVILRLPSMFLEQSQLFQ